MIYITDMDIEKRNKQLDDILKDFIQKTKNVEFIEDLNQPLSNMRENSFLYELYDIFYDKCPYNDEEKKLEYIYSNINKLSIKQGLEIILNKYNIQHLNLMIIAEDIVSTVSNLKVCA